MCQEEQKVIQQIREIKSFLSLYATLYKFKVADKKDWYNAYSIYRNSSARYHAEWYDVVYMKT